MTGARLSHDGRTLTVRVPMAFAKRGGRKVIVAPDGGHAWVLATPRRDETLIRALARAYRWKRMLEDGRKRSAKELADIEGVDAPFFTVYSGSHSWPLTLPRRSLMAASRTA